METIWKHTENRTWYAARLSHPLVEQILKYESRSWRKGDVSREPFNHIVLNPSLAIQCKKVSQRRHILSKETREWASQRRRSSSKTVFLERRTAAARATAEDVYWEDQLPSPLPPLQLAAAKGRAHFFSWTAVVASPNMNPSSMQNFFTAKAPTAI